MDLGGQRRTRRPPEAVWSRISLPAFDAAKKMAAPAAATGSMSSVSAVVYTCRPSGSRGENVPDDGGNDGADDGRADAGARVGERPPGRPHARSHGGPSGGVETRLQAGLVLERGLSGRAVDCMGEGSALILHPWDAPRAPGSVRNPRGCRNGPSSCSPPVGVAPASPHAQATEHCGAPGEAT